MFCFHVLEPLTYITFFLIKSIRAWVLGAVDIARPIAVTQSRGELQSVGAFLLDAEAEIADVVLGAFTPVRKVAEARRAVKARPACSPSDVWNHKEKTTSERRKSFLKMKKKMKKSFQKKREFKSKRSKIVGKIH